MPYGRLFMEMKRCRRCTHTKPVEEFRKYPDGRISGECIPCLAYAAEWVKNKRARDIEFAKRDKAATKERVMKIMRKARRDVIAHYGGKCACCGEAHIEFLHLDHIEGGGTQQRAELKRWGNAFYRWLQKQGYPEGFRVLCANCNEALGHYGYCPRELETAEKVILQPANQEAVKELLTKFQSAVQQ